MKVIKYDSTSGNLTDGILWQADWSDLPYDGRHTAELLRSEGRDVFACKLDSTHRTDIEMTSITVDLFPGTFLGDFVPMPLSGLDLVSSKLTERLERSGLTGFEFADIIQIETDELRRFDHEKLYLLNITGHGGTCDRLVFQGGDNLCPTCESAIVICPDCGKLNNPCAICGNFTICNNIDSSTNHLFYKFMYNQMPEQFIVDSKLWDGCDIFQVHGMIGGGVFVTRKAKEWFERECVTDVRFTPALLNMHVDSRLGNSS